MATLGTCLDSYKLPRQICRSTKDAFKSASRFMCCPSSIPSKLEESGSGRVNRHHLVVSRIDRNFGSSTLKLQLGNGMPPLVAALVLRVLTKCRLRGGTSGSLFACTAIAPATRPRYCSISRSFSLSGAAHHFGGYLLIFARVGHR